MQNEPLVLDVDLSKVDTSIPVLPPELYDLKVDSITKEENKDKNGFNAKVKFTTTTEITDVKGSPVKIGFPLFSYYPLQNKAEAEDKEQWKKNFAMLQDAALNCSVGNRPARFDANEIIGKIVRANVKVEPYEGRDTNKIGNLQFPT